MPADRVHIIILPDMRNISSHDFNNLPSAYKITWLMYGQTESKSGEESEVVALHNINELPQVINELVKDDKETDFILFLAPDIGIDENIISGLCKELREDGKAIGVNPVFTDRRGERATFLGTVFDSQNRIINLYEGIKIANPLVCRKRYFQIASNACLLLARKSFLAAGGLKANDHRLVFFELCITLSQLSGKHFAVCPDIQVKHEDRMAETEFAGFWNSLIMRGKIRPSIVHPDYFLKVKDDGLRYGVNEWLNEGPENAVFYDADDKWLKWRQDANPYTLLAWIGSLTQLDMREYLPIIRSYPALLPPQLRYYEALENRQREFSKNNGLNLMFAQCEAWRRKKRIFYYGKLRKGMELLNKTGMYDISLDNCPASYDAWLTLSPNAASCSENIGNGPRIAIVMPVYNPDHVFLKQAIESVLAQNYQNWELCIADDASTDPEVAGLLKHYVEMDDRIKVTFREKNGHIAEATNSALQLVTAAWAGFMDQDDMLAENALHEVAKIAETHKDAILIYSDEDHIDAYGIRRSPIFKPDFDPEVFFTGHLSVFSTVALRKAGGLRKGYEGSQDYDLTLRIVEGKPGESILHIPRILYHWRVHEDSTAGSLASKPYVLKATKKAQEDAASRRDLKAISIMTELNNFFVLKHVNQLNKKSAIVILSEDDTENAELLNYINSIKEENITIRHIHLKGDNKLTGTTGFAACRHAAENMDAEVFLFIHAGLAPLPGCDPAQLLHNALRPEISAVGSLIYDNNVLWNGGYYPNKTGRLFPLLKNSVRFELKIKCWGQFMLPRTTLGAAWQCVAVRRDTLLEFEIDVNENLGSYALPDFCLAQMRQKNRYFMVSSWGQWRWIKSPAPQDEGEEVFYQRWHETIQKCGLRNANLDEAQDFNWKLLI